jgi:hypothetical protein
MPLSCPGSPVTYVLFFQAYLSRMNCQAYLSRLSCPSCPSEWSYPSFLSQITFLAALSERPCPGILSQLSCHDPSTCPVLAVLFWQSCPLFPVLYVLFQLSSLAFLSQLSCAGYCVPAAPPSCPVPAILSTALLTLLSCPGLSSLFCPSSPVQTDRSRLSCLSDPVPDAIF